MVMMTTASIVLGLLGVTAATSPGGLAAGGGPAAVGPAREGGHDRPHHTAQNSYDADMIREPGRPHQPGGSNCWHAESMTLTAASKNGA